MKQKGKTIASVCEGFHGFLGVIVMMERAHISVSMFSSERH